MESKIFWRIIEDMFNERDLSNFKSERGWVSESKAKIRQIL